MPAQNNHKEKSGKLEYQGKKNSQSKEQNQQQTQPTYDGPRIEPRPHWWEASALTTVPSLLTQTSYPFIFETIGFYF